MTEHAGADPGHVADIAVARRRRRSDGAALLAGIGLFDGFSETDLDGLASVFTPVELAPGEVLWRQGAPCKGLAVLLTGEMRVLRQLPGERELELACLGPGELMGEIALLSGGAHTATVRCTGSCSMLLLGRAEFEFRMMSHDLCALALKRRLVAIACRRLRRAHADLAATTDQAPPSQGSVPRTIERSEPAPAAAPPLAYLSRLPLFRALEPDLIAELLDGGSVLAFPRGCVIQQQSARADRCYVTLNGAVEEMVHRRGSPLRVSFAGPGHAFGFVGLLDGEPAPATALTRERSVVLAIEAEHFMALLSRGGGRSRPFATAVEAELIAAMLTVERTQSHLAARSA